MKTNFRLLLMTILCIGLFTNCTFTLNSGDSIKPSKNYITRNYEVKDFALIDINAVGNVNFTQTHDGSSSLSIYGPDNIVGLMNVSVKNNTLQITLKEDIKNNIKNLKINIAAPTLNRLTMGGVGNIQITDSLTTDQLEIRSEGVGNIQLTKLQCEVLDVKSKGVGNIELKGLTQKVTLSSEGVGNIKAEDLQAAQVEATSRGIGAISCYATESINASAEGIGSISYKGNPTQKKIKKEGIGSIKNI